MAEFLLYLDPGSTQHLDMSNKTAPQVKQCDNGSFCCGTPDVSVNNLATECCQAGNGFFIGDNGTITLANATFSTSTHPAPSTSLVSSTNTSSTIISTSQTSSSTPTPAPTSKNTGAIAGGTIGGVAALAIIAALIFYFFRPRKKEQILPPEKEYIGSPHLQETDGKAIPWEASGNQVAEMDARYPPSAGKRNGTELQA